MGEKIFENFFWSKSTQNGLNREKKQKKNSGGGPKFFLKKGNHKKSQHAKVDQRRSSHLFRNPPPYGKGCFEYSPFNVQYI